VLATAQIQGMGETSVRINEHPAVNLDLRITGPGVDFTDRKRVTVDFTKQYEIDWQASALVAGVVPMQITSSEDHKSYDLTGQAGPLMEILQIYQAG
jgi:hypothetical protein